MEAQVVNANFEKLNPTGLRVIRDGPSIVISPNTNFKLHLFQESSGIKLKFWSKRALGWPAFSSEVKRGEGAPFMMKYWLIEKSTSNNAMSQIKCEAKLLCICWLYTWGLRRLPSGLDARSPQVAKANKNRNSHKNSKTPLIKTTITTIKHNEWKPHNYKQNRKQTSKNINSKLIF